MHPVLDLVLALFSLFLGIHSLVNDWPGFKWKVLSAVEFFMAGALLIMSIVEFALLK